MLSLLMNSTVSFSSHSSYLSSILYVLGYPGTNLPVCIQCGVSFVAFHVQGYSTAASYVLCRMLNTMYLVYATTCTVQSRYTVQRSTTIQHPYTLHAPCRSSPSVPCVKKYQIINLSTNSKEITDNNNIIALVPNTYNI
jgi:hypothetical protein